MGMGELCRTFDGVWKRLGAFFVCWERFLFAGSVFLLAESVVLAGSVFFVCWGDLFYRSVVCCWECFCCFCFAQGFLFLL